MSSAEKLLAENKTQPYEPGMLDKGRVSAAGAAAAAGSTAGSTIISLDEVLECMQNNRENECEGKLCDFQFQQHYAAEFTSELLLNVNETLIRKDFVSIMAPIIRDLLLKRSTHRKLLQGIGGCGKSTILAQAVALCRRAGIVVLSIPKLSAFIATDGQLIEDTATNCIFQNMQFGEASLESWKLRPRTKNKHAGKPIQSLLDLMKLRDEFSSLQILMDCIDEIYYSEQSRGIIVVDQWNAADVVTQSECALAANVQSFFQRIMHITKHKSNKSSFLGATSSSFILNSDTLDDGDIMLVPRELQQFSKEEFERVWTAYLKHYPQLSNIDKPHLIEYTSGIPRLIATYASCYLENETLAFELFKKRSRDYYTMRLDKLVIRNREKHFADYAVRLFARGFADARAVDDKLLQTGLLRKEGDVLVPVCLAAYNAFALSCVKHKDTFMSLLAEDSTLNWRLFEYYFASAWELEGIERLLQLYGKDMRGTKSLSIEISCSKKIYRKSSGGTFSDVSIQKGDLCVLAPGFPVVDFAAHSKHNDKLCVIQISKSVYSRHPAKAEDLYSKTVTTVNGEETVADFLFRSAFGKKRTHTDIIEYVYISPVQGYCNKHMDHAMIVCELEELAKIDPNKWPVLKRPMQELAGSSASEQRASVPKARGAKRAWSTAASSSAENAEQDQSEEQSVRPAKRAKTASSTGDAAEAPTKEQIANKIRSLVVGKKVKKPQQPIEQKFCLKISNADWMSEIHTGLQAMGVPVVKRVADGVHVIMDEAEAQKGKTTNPCYEKNLRLLPIEFIFDMFEKGVMPDETGYEDMRNYFKQAK